MLEFLIRGFLYGDVINSFYVNVWILEVMDSQFLIFIYLLHLN